MRICAMALLLALAACKEELAELPDPVPLTPETQAHYCMMNIAEHPGPKAQVHLDGLPVPVFFAQVRDAFTYLASAEQDGYVTAVYVHDMTGADWDRPQDWILAQEAHYVVGSRRTGGMGAPELVPFSDLHAAEAFAVRFGGTIHDRDAVPSEAFLAPVEIVLAPEVTQ